jgi:hypothetical protein
MSRKPRGHSMFGNTRPRQPGGERGSRNKPAPVPFPVPVPDPKGLVLDVKDVLDATEMAAIKSAKKIVFHTVGDTGGVRDGATEETQIAEAMEADFSGDRAEHPAFFYHLGDVVYYNGEPANYEAQYFRPYQYYPAPIFAIAGNHDGVMYEQEPVDYSLQPFVDNFCTTTPTASVPSFSRTTMTQPGVYFVLTAPFVRFIGLYSNTGEEMGIIGDDSTIGQDQVDFLTQQLSAALAARNATGAAPEALILAVHHPPFTGSSEHFPSAAMLAQIDTCCQQAGIWPDLVLSGHAHLYERYTRTMATGGNQIAYVVAGNGGYYNLSKITTNDEGETPTPGDFTEPDGQGNTLSFDQYNDSDFGFLRITVSAASILVEALGIDMTAAAGTPPATIDQFTIDLTAHTVTTGTGSSFPNVKKPGSTHHATKHTSHHSAKKKPASSKTRKSGR